MSALERLETRSTMRSHGLTMEKNNDIYEMSSMQQTALYPNSMLEQHPPAAYGAPLCANNSVLPYTQPTVRASSLEHDLRLRAFERANSLQNAARMTAARALA